MHSECWAILGFILFNFLANYTKSVKNRAQNSPQMVKECPPIRDRHPEKEAKDTMFSLYSWGELRGTKNSFMTNLISRRSFWVLGPHQSVMSPADNITFHQRLPDFFLLLGVEQASVFCLYFLENQICALLAIIFVSEHS